VLELFLVESRRAQLVSRGQSELMFTHHNQALVAPLYNGFTSKHTKLTSIRIKFVEALLEKLRE
jgi:hypothetical protein